MHQNWVITGDKIERVQRFYVRYEDNPFVLGRAERNLRADKEPVNKRGFWKEMVVAVSTTQSKSGPTSGVARLARTAPFRLRYNRCLGADDTRGFVEMVLVRYGVRFAQKKAGQITANLQRLRGKDNRVWDEVDAVLENLRLHQDRDTEREAARFLQRRKSGTDRGFAGLGPKQSRNVLQMLGLTRYETPLDSRVKCWLKRFGFPVEFDLSRESSYCRVMDDFQELCETCGVVPCQLDAAIFASFDYRRRWTAKAVKGVY